MPVPTVCRGIVNGIDYDDYQSGDRSYIITKNYNADNLPQGKSEEQACSFRESWDWRRIRQAMMIGIVSRLTDQKGFDLIAYVMDELCQDAVQIVVLGTGDETL